jgi:hypothetical protein
MTLAYHRFDPAPCAFPRPRVPVLPPLSRSQLGPARPEPDARRRHHARGRYALHAAYALAGVGPQGALLAPAYHCRTMLDPALRLGAEVALYPLTPDLHADLDGLQRAAAASRTPPVALLLTHFFGLPRRVDEVAAWCRARGIALIEDCSHALPGTGGDAASGRPAIGHSGRWAVSSPYKFFPCPDGGWLWANGDAPLPETPRRSPGARAELRGALTAWGQLRQARTAPDPTAIAAELAALGPRLDLRGRDWTDHGPSLSDEYAPADEGTGSLAVSRWIERHTDLALLVQRRQAHYRQWLAAVQGLPDVAALLPDLPPGVAPYMFALRVDNPPRLFYPLKQLGVPIWRWDDMAISGCAVSQRYRQGVFHLPCHQALDDAQMAWMTAAVRAVATCR